MVRNKKPKKKNERDVYNDFFFGTTRRIRVYVRIIIIIIILLYTRI